MIVTLMCASFIIGNIYVNGTPFVKVVQYHRGSGPVFPCRWITLSGIYNWRTDRHTPHKKYCWSLLSRVKSCISSEVIDSTARTGNSGRTYATESPEILKSKWRWISFLGKHNRSSYQRSCRSFPYSRFRTRAGIQVMFKPDKTIWPLRSWSAGKSMWTRTMLHIWSSYTKYQYHT